MQSNKPPINWKRSFTQPVFWLNCSDCSIPATGCVSLFICRCKVPRSRFWCHFLQFRQDLRQALGGKWWFWLLYFFPSHRNVAVSWAAARYSWESLARGWSKLCCSPWILSRAVLLLFGCSLYLCCSALFVYHWSTRIREKLSPVVKMLFPMDDCGHVSRLKPLLQLCCGPSCWEQELQYP